MVELDERYVDVIVARWQNLTGRNATRAPIVATLQQGSP
jgi:hypothetical protein